ncbi:MAG TPA: glycosyltransferase family 4 protein [Methanocella sp.]|nr:glycosyltransferase family 4 protein [Methanocella sp.]
MRIAQVCPRYKPHIGGVETVVGEVSRRLVPDHDVTVVTTDPSRKLPRQETIDGVSVVRFPALAPGDAYYLAPALRRFLQVEQFDVVHAHGYHAFPALLATVSDTKRFVFTPHYHGKGHTWFRNLLHKPYRLIGTRTFGRADVIVCDSEFEKSLVCRDFPQYCGKTGVISLGIAKKEFGAVEPYPGASNILLYVGRLEEYKGIQHVINALPLLQRYELVVIGKGPYMDGLKRAVVNAGVEGRVKFLEELSRQELLRWYATADVFLMLSSFEAFGITVAEALASGTPCVVAKSSSLSEFVDEGLCRGIDLPTSPKTIADAVLGAKKVPYTKEILDWDDVARRLLSVYMGAKP